MREKAGSLGNPGMVWVSPAMARMKPAPAMTRTSLMGKTKPDGAPISLGSWEREAHVFAIQTGKRAEGVPSILPISEIAFSDQETFSAP